MQQFAKASLLDKPKGNFVIGEYPIPEMNSKGILMKIELCGVCGTDLHTWDSEDIGLPYPISLGHEIVGTVADLGPQAKSDYIGKPLKIGDRISVIPAIHCHKCYFCTIAKTPEKCIDWKTYGTWPNADQEPHFTGGYAEYLYIHDPNSVVLKLDTTAERGVFLEPMAVVVHAMLHAQIKPGDTVAIQGVGPIGLLTVACAKICGASKVIAIGRKNRLRVDLAKEMGADIAICREDIPENDDVMKLIKDSSLSGYGADVVFNTVGSPKAFEESLDFVRPSGTFVEVGNFVDTGTMQFNPCKHLLEKGIKIIGSFDNEAEHFVRALPIISDDRIPITKLITHTLPLEAVQDVLAKIRSGEKIHGKDIVKAVINPWI